MGYRRSRADKGHLEKLTRMYHMTVDASGNFAQFDVNWLATGVSGQSSVFFTGSGGSVSTQFAQCAGMYREYYLSSVKIEYRPDRLDAGNSAGISISPIEVGTTMDSMNVQPTIGSLDYKQYDPTRPFKRFYRIKQYARQKFL